MKTEYTLIREIGRGGMGSVYEGRSPDGRRVAIKMMNNKATLNPEFKEFFFIEAAALKKMKHPSVVGIVDDPFPDEQGNLYLPMEFIDGETIEHRIRTNGPCSEKEAKAWMEKILDAMEYVHSMNCIHRDIKPSNIMIRPDHSICIIDFGIAKDMKTRTGKTIGRIIGTDGYMSPEQAKGDSVDYRTDIYSLGCLLHYLLTGEHAVQMKSNDYDTILSILHDVFPRAQDSRPDLSDRIQETILKAVDKNMLRRFQTVREFKAALSGPSTPPDSEEAHSLKTRINPDRVRITVGRRDCDITVTGDYISGCHAEIEYLEKANTGSKSSYLLFIDKSTNGTSVDGRYLHRNSIEIPFSFEAPVRLPDIFLAGRSEYRLDWNEVIARLQEKRGTVSPPPPPPPPPPPLPADKLGIGYAILSFLCPIVGWVLWAQWKKETPRRARQAAVAAWIGFIIGMIINILSKL